QVVEDCRWKGVVNWDPKEADSLYRSISNAAINILTPSVVDSIRSDGDCQSQLAHLVIQSLDSISGSKRNRRNRASQLLVEYPEGTTTEQAIRGIEAVGLTQPTLYRISNGDFCLSLSGREVRLSPHFLPAIHIAVCYYWYFNLKYTPLISDAYHTFEKLFGANRGSSPNADVLCDLIRNCS
ncbi:hypothetical protein PFISCL1PPCAC_1230, partial [Pristionchus fissidentatus]